MLGISAASGLIGLWFIGIGWWYLRRANPNAVNPSASSESSRAVKPVKQDKHDRGREKCKADSLLMAREVQELLAAKFSAAELPQRLQRAAEDVRDRIDVIFAEQAEAPEETSNGDPLKELSLEAPDVDVPSDPFLLSTDFREYRFKDLLGVGGFGRVELIEELHSGAVPAPVAAWKALDKLDAAQTGETTTSWGGPDTEGVSEWRNPA
eukprot:s45_g19.t1